MKKLTAALLSVFFINGSAAYADDFEEGFDLGVEAMQSVVTVCFAELRSVLQGYDLKRLGDRAEDVFKEIPDAHPTVVSAYRRGLKMSGLDDPSLQRDFMGCIDQRMQRILN